MALKRHDRVLLADHGLRVGIVKEVAGENVRVASATARLTGAWTSQKHIKAVLPRRWWQGYHYLIP